MKPFLELNSSKNLFTLKKNFHQLDIKHIQNEVFDNKGYFIINNFISKDDAIFIKNLLLKNHHCFKKTSDEGNHRLFMYPGGPYSYPLIFKQLYKHASILKNMVNSSQKYYLDYCSSIGADMHDAYSVLEHQKMHNWSAFYWYKNNDGHFKHIDGDGEFTCFVILSELGEDYSGGGLYVDGIEGNVDEIYEYGDLVFFDQASHWHEVKKIITEQEQKGRLALYVPTIPYGRNKTFYRFEDHPFRKFCSERLNTYQKNIKYIGALLDNDIHYSRLNYFKHFKN
jgi:hypothetical protein